VDAKPAPILCTLTTHNVGVGVHGPRGQVVVEGEMGPPRLVDDERLAPAVAGVDDGGQICAGAVRFRAADQGGDGIGVPLPGGFEDRSSSPALTSTSDRNVSSSSTARVGGSAPRPWRWPGGVKAVAVLLVIGGQGIEQRGLAVVQADVVTAEAPV
jgi:hypothetical protein